VKNKAIETVQEMLGHSSLATTERYLHLTITDLKEAHSKFIRGEELGLLDAFCEDGHYTRSFDGLI